MERERGSKNRSKNEAPKTKKKEEIQWCLAFSVFFPFGLVSLMDCVRDGWKSKVEEGGKPPPKTHGETATTMKEREREREWWWWWWQHLKPATTTGKERKRALQKEKKKKEGSWEKMIKARTQIHAKKTKKKEAIKVIAK